MPARLRDLLDVHIKSADPYPGMPGYAVQTYAPISRRRDLTPDEEAAVEAGSSRWLPKIFQHYGTPLPEMMSSPGKGAIMSAPFGAAAGAALGGLVGHKLDPSSDATLASGIGLGGLGGAGAAALLAYLVRQQGNEGIREIMRRLPPGATKRDYVADPAVQADMNRQAMLSASAMGGGGYPYKYGSDVLDAHLAKAAAPLPAVTPPASPSTPGHSGSGALKMPWSQGANVNALPGPPSGGIGLGAAKPTTSPVRPGEQGFGKPYASTGIPHGLEAPSPGPKGYATPVDTHIRYLNLPRARQQALLGANPTLQDAANTLANKSEISRLIGSGGHSTPRGPLLQSAWRTEERALGEFERRLHEVMGGGYQDVAPGLAKGPTTSSLAGTARPAEFVTPRPYSPSVSEVDTTLPAVPNADVPETPAAPIPPREKLLDPLQFRPSPYR